VTNETFPLLGPNCRGVRTLYSPDGATDYGGWLGGTETDDVVNTLDHPAWLNLDDRIGVRFSGPGKTVYHNRHYHVPYHAIADDLVLSRLEGERSLRTGEATQALTALLIPEQSHAETPRSALGVLSGPDDTACLTADGYLAAASSGTTARTCVFQGTRPESVPVYCGATVEAVGRELRVAVDLGARSAGLLRAERCLRVDGDVRVDSMGSGATYVVNVGQADGRVQNDTGGAESVAPRGVLVL